MSDEYFHAQKVNGGWIIETPEGQSVTTKDNDVVKTLKTMIATTKPATEAVEGLQQVLNEG